MAARPRGRRFVDALSPHSAALISLASAVSSPPPFRMVHGASGLHNSVRQFLAGIFPEVPGEEFRSAMEDPFYEPRDRLLVEHGSRIVAHVQMLHRAMRFGAVALPVSRLAWLATTPEFRRQGHARALIAAAEEQMRREGSLLGLLWTREPAFFERLGWAVCGRRCESVAGTHAILAALGARGHCHARTSPLSVRPCRRIEANALVRIYNQNAARMFGPLERTEAYWQWLLRRKGYDEIHLAVRGHGRRTLSLDAPVVGYAISRGGKIVELLTADRHPAAMLQLVIRACRDALEHGRVSLAIEAPHGSRVHKLFRAAGGEFRRGPEVLMAKVLDPVRLLETLAGRLHARAAAASLPRPMTLELAVDGRPMQIALTADGVLVADGIAQPGQTTCDSPRLGRLAVTLPVFSQMVLGQVAWGRLGETASEGSGRRGALGLAVPRILFPRLRGWHPPLDDLPSRESS